MRTGIQDVGTGNSVWFDVLLWGAVVLAAIALAYRLGYIGPSAPQRRVAPVQRRATLKMEVPPRGRTSVAPIRKRSLRRTPTPRPSSRRPVARPRAHPQPSPHTR